jgi:TrmH RNA methyltransferase
VRIAGLNAVQSLFATSPDRIVRLFYTDEQRHHVGEIAKALAEARKPYRLVEPDELERIAGTVLHGGILALAEPAPLPEFDPATIPAMASERASILILDGVGNPHNLGAIARTAAFFGVKHLLLSGHHDQAAPSGAAYRVAQGGLDHLAVHRAADIGAAIAALKDHYRVIGTSLGASTALTGVARDARPVALVLGNEETGVPDATLAACHEVVRIPGSGAVQSLNVAATAAILIYALLGP